MACFLLGQGVDRVILIQTSTTNTNVEELFIGGQMLSMKSIKIQNLSMTISLNQLQIYYAI